MSTGTSGVKATNRRYGQASKVDREAATKQTTVEFVAKAADEQVVTGVVMVPNSVDRQGDFETPETIEGFADDFQALYDNESADGGIMHAAWPSEWMHLEHNGIVGRDDLPEEVDPETVEDGYWLQSWRVEDDGLWDLIEDEVITGFSIGARDVTWRGPMEQSELPDEVDVPDEYDTDAPVYELEDGIVREVSTVDTPAVPDALILAKNDADSEKRLGDYLGDREAFLEECAARGHSDADAERLWDVLSRAAEVDGAGEPGAKSLYERVGRAAAKALPGLPNPETESGTEPDGSDTKSDDAPVAEAQTRTDTDATSNKEGRTPSRQNRDSLFATIDASLDILEDAGVNHGMTRFTDSEDYSFDLSEHTARSWPKPNDDDEDDDESTADAPDDTDTTDTTESMTDDNQDDIDDTNDDPFKDAPAWAASLKDSVEANSEQINELADKAGEPDDTDPLEDAPAWAKALAGEVESNAEAIESIGKQSGFSTQVASNGDGGEDPDADKSLAGVLSRAGVN